MLHVHVFDPTQTDDRSKVRGIGRYLKILKENFSDKFKFTVKLHNWRDEKKSVFINPFLNFLQPPVTIKRIANKQIAIIHDVIPLIYPKHFPVGVRGKLNILLNRWLLKDYDLIITVSQASRENIIEMLRVGEKKVKVIYNCLSNNFAQIATSINLNLNTIPDSFCLYVGDATWNKNLVNMAKAVKILNVPCVLVGKVFSQTNSYLSHPWQRELRKFLELVKDDKRFIFPGFVTDDDLIKLYQQAKVNVLVSHIEGFGLPYLEAASQKTPSVLSDIPVFHEIAQDTALFADPSNPYNIANQIGEIYFHPQLQKKLGEKSYQQSRKFIAPIFKKNFLQAIKN